MSYLSQAFDAWAQVDSEVWPTGAAGDLGRALQGAGVAVSAEEVRRNVASRDFAWLSPVLSAKLPGPVADLVAYPASPEELALCVGEAAERGVPMTLRGRGTGNYGQCVPLAGGMVIDTAALDKVIEVGPGWARAQPGASCMKVERAARSAGQELTIFPSTTSSTIGGFVSGGTGGSGSIEYGMVWDGFVLAMDVLPATPACQPVAVTPTGPAPGAVMPADLGPTPSSMGSAPFLGTYGTVGVISELTVALGRAWHWTGLAASAAGFEAAIEAARALLASGAAVRLLGVSEAALVPDFPPAPWLSAGRASLRAVVDVDNLGLACAAIRSAGAQVDATAEDLVGPVTQLSFNHVTLRAKRADAGICHLQLAAPDLPGQVAALRRHLPEARLHVDAMRAGGDLGFSGLVISRFGGEQALRASMRALADEGVRVVDPHTWAVWDPTGSVAEVASFMDPDALLNPGKLARPGPRRLII